MNILYVYILKKKLTVISFPLVNYGDQPGHRGINFLKLKKNPTMQDGDIL